MLVGHLRINARRNPNNTRMSKRKRKETLYLVMEPDKTSHIMRKRPLCCCMRKSQEVFRNPVQSGSSTSLTQTRNLVLSRSDSLNMPTRFKNPSRTSESNRPIEHVRMNCLSMINRLFSKFFFSQWSLKLFWFIIFS